MIEQIEWLSVDEWEPYTSSRKTNWIRVIVWEELDMGHPFNVAFFNRKEGKFYTAEGRHLRASHWAPEPQGPGND